MTVNQPFGWCGGGRAHDNLEASLRQYFDRTIQPCPLVLPWFGFNPAPGEFTDTDLPYPECVHTLGIAAPDCLRPMLRVVTDS